MSLRRWPWTRRAATCATGLPTPSWERSIASSRKAIGSRRSARSHWWSFPRASEGLGNGKAQYFFPIWMQKSWGKWTTYGGGGYWLTQSKGNRDWWYFGWLLQRQLTDNFLLGLEIYQTTPDAAGSKARTGFNIGAVYDFDEHHHLMGPIGRDFTGRTRLAWYLAFQFTF